jgi:hypothetical protein
MSPVPLGLLIMPVSGGVSWAHSPPVSLGFSQCAGGGALKSGHSAGLGGHGISEGAVQAGWLT